MTEEMVRGEGVQHQLVPQPEHPIDLAAVHPHHSAQHLTRDSIVHQLRHQQINSINLPTGHLQEVLFPPHDHQLLTCLHHLLDQVVQGVPGDLAAEAAAEQVVVVEEDDKG